VNSVGIAAAVEITVEAPAVTENQVLAAVGVDGSLGAHWRCLAAIV
jgi:hypothetical protein